MDDIPTKKEILEKIGSGAKPGTNTHDYHIYSLIAKCTDEIKTSIDLFSASSNKLGTKILCLNIILTIATVVYAIVNIFQYCYQISQ